MFLPHSSTMKERIFLCLLCLSGWSVSPCLPRQFHYVADPMTWTEAQTHCREKYTDLATVENKDEMDQLKSVVSSYHHNGHVWIGLYSNIKWKWSDGYKWTGSDYRNWKKLSQGEPNFYGGNEYCVIVSKNASWSDADCQKHEPFFCYKGTQKEPDLVFVRGPMNWSSAQKFCRENSVDLATVRNDADNQKIQNSLPKAGSIWIGLYRDPDMSWSDGSRVSFQFWDTIHNPLGSMSVVCGASYQPNSGKWRLKSCEEKYKFVCYSAEKKKRHVIKLRMKPDDPSVDLNDPAVKAALLKKLQDRLKENGLSGVTLKWREQPDGKVFHKEEESSQKKDREKCEL